MNEFVSIAFPCSCHNCLSNRRCCSICHRNDALASAFALKLRRQSNSNTIAFTLNIGSWHRTDAISSTTMKGWAAHIRRRETVWLAIGWLDIATNWAFCAITIIAWKEVNVETVLPIISAYHCIPFPIFTDQLKILYEVVSIDGWERERTEGYATISIPLMPGRFREKVRCYRDVGNDTWIDWLQRYFVGGRRKVRLNEFNGIGAEEDFNRTANGLNRYGNKTETTGYLSIVRNVIVQRHVDTKTKSSKINKNRSRREAKIHNLLSTYQEARERLAAITEM